MASILRFWKQGDVRHYYDLKQELGKGTFSVVRLGVNKKSGKKSAIKIINKKSTNVETRQMLDIEIQILQRVEHPNVIGMEAMYETKSHLFLVMEYVEGGELFDRIVERGCFSEKDAANIIRQILEAVKYLHSLGIVHRDLKPENVLCATKEAMDVKIADFGLSKILDTDKTQILQTCCGTPSYAAPELLLCEGYAEPVDMWAVGIILYTLLSGCLPFFGETHTELFERILAGAYAFPDPEWTSITASAKSLVSALLTADPKQRLSADQALKHPWVLEATGTNLTGLSGRIEGLVNARKSDKFSGRKSSTLRDRYNPHPTHNNILGPQLFDVIDDEDKKLPKTSANSTTEAREALVWQDSRDWPLMSKGASIIKFSKDEIILKEGTINRDLFRIKTGSVRVEKSRQEGIPSVTLITMGKDMMFGEISMLQPSGLVSASIIADQISDIYQISISHLKSLFEKEHALSERFFRELALKQAQRLTLARQRIEELLEKEGPSSSTIRSATAAAVAASSVQAIRNRTASFANTSISNKTFKEFSKTFGLGENEPCILVVPCRWKRTLLHAGTLYLSENYLCATYSFFALKTKHVIPFTTISNIEGDKSTLELKFNHLSKDSKSKKTKVVIQLQNEEDFKNVLETAEELWQEVGPKHFLTSQTSQAHLLTHQSSSLGPYSSLPSTTEVDQSLSDALTADDWKLILEKSKQQFFDKNQVVIHQGDPSAQNLYQLARGRCRVQQQRPEDDFNQVLGYINAGETFGEISFLHNSQVTASVVADEDKVEIYVIEGDYLNEIFNENAGVPGRFYKYLATLISNRLHHREIELLLG